jgi:hypothetical protein
VLETAADILRPHHWHHRGQTTWPERVFITIDGREQSVASMWEGGPLWLRSTVAIARVVGSKPFSRLFELTRADGFETLETDCQPKPLVEALPTLTPDSAPA